MKGEPSNMPLTPAEDGGDYVSGDTRPHASSPAMGRRAHAGAIFLLVNIIVLYVLHFADRGNGGSASKADAVAGAFQRSALSAASDEASSGRAVSIAADGSLVVGAGASIFLDAVDLPTDKKTYSYLQLSSMTTSLADDASSVNLVAYQTGTAPKIQSVVTTFTADERDSTITFTPEVDANVISGGSVKALATLSNSSAVMLYSVTSADGMSVSAFAVSLALDGNKVELVNKDAPVLAANGSTTNFMAPISSSAFAVAFYEPYTSDAAGWGQRVTVGVVAADGSLAFIDESVSFGEPNANSVSTTFGQPQAVFNSSDRVTVPYFAQQSSFAASPTDGSSAATTVETPASVSRGLCLATFKFDAKTASLTSETTSETCEARFEPKYYVESARLTDNAVAFVFVDHANGDALTVATVEFSPLTGTPTFRSTFVIDNVAGAFDFGAAYGFYPKPVVRVLSQQRLAIGFMNPANAGKPSVVVLRFGADDLSLAAISPVLPLANADFELATADPNAFQSIVMDLLPLQAGFVVAYTGAYAGVQQQRVSMGNALGHPVGVVSDTDGDDFNVAMSGTVAVDGSSLTAGQGYYAATNGKLYAASTSAAGDAFVLAEDDSIVLSKDAFVGVAVSDDKLFVSAQAN